MDNKSLSDSRSRMSHVWVKVGHSKNEPHRYSGVGCNHGVQPDCTMECISVCVSYWLHIEKYIDFSVHDCSHSCVEELPHLENCMDTSDFCTELQSEFIPEKTR